MRVPVTNAEHRTTASSGHPVAVSAGTSTMAVPDWTGPVAFVG